MGCISRILHELAYSFWYKMLQHVSSRQVGWLNTGAHYIPHFMIVLLTIFRY